MTESEICTILSALAKEIELLRYQNEQLENENRKLRETQHIEVNIHAKP